MPLGISIASQARLSSISSYIRTSLLFRRNCFLFSLERRLQSVPRQGCAFHPRGKFGDAGEYCELSEFGLLAIRSVTCDDVMETFKKLFGFCPGFAFEALRHHGSGRLRNCATGSLKGDVANGVSLHVQEYGEMVPTERIVTLGFMVGILQFAIVPRSLAVLED